MATIVGELWCMVLLSRLLILAGQAAAQTLTLWQKGEPITHSAAPSQATPSAFRLLSGC